MLRWENCTDAEESVKEESFVSLFIVAAIIIATVSGSALILQSIERQKATRAQIAALRQETEVLQIEIEKTREDVRVLSEKVEKLVERFQSWDVKIMEATAYAPLDPRAIEGMCFSGDPRITASGEKIVPGMTVAAGRGLPFGTNVWIEGIGRRVVQDRGGRITDRHLDIAVGTKEEAVEWGRRNVVVFVEQEE